ncbi:MAG: radical SAM protein [Thermodesulfovibrionia bacterium]
MYSPFRHVGSILWKNNPIHLTFFVTSRCNLRCSYCFYLSGKRDEGLPELSLDEIEKVSSSMKNLLWLAFSGGEVFLRDDIVDITRIFYEQNKPSIILFSTNGSLTDTIEDAVGSIIRYCKKSTIVVKLSLDGHEALNDRLRGKGSFRRAMETYNRLRRYVREYPNFELGVNTVFCKDNQDSMDEVIDLVKGLDDIKTHTVSLIREIKDSGFKIQEDIDIDKYHKTIKRMESEIRAGDATIYRFRGARLKSAQDILQRRFIYKTLLNRRQLIPCYAGRLNIVLTETGNLYPCESFRMGFGNVREYGYNIKGLLNTKHSKRILSLIKNRDCYCTHECYLMTNILFNPAMLPVLLLEYMRLW